MTLVLLYVLFVVFIQCFVLSEPQLHLLVVTALLASVADLLSCMCIITCFDQLSNYSIHSIHSIVAILYMAVQSVCEHAVRFD